MYNKAQKRKQQPVSSRVLSEKFGLSYIHGPYPIETSYLFEHFSYDMILIISSDHNTTCIGCVFIPLDQFFMFKIRTLFLYVQFQVVIIEIAPKIREETLLMYDFLLRLRQLSSLFSLHCIILDRSQNSCCKHWPIFSLVICWKQKIQQFIIHN